RHSSTIASDRHELTKRKPAWQPLPAIAAAAAIVVLVPVGVVLLRDRGLPLGGTEAVMLMSQVGEIRQVDLADGSKVTLDTATRIDVEIRRSRRHAHLRYGRARFRIARAGAPFVVETDGGTITTSQGVIDVEQFGEQGRVHVLAGAADVRRLGAAEASPVALGAGEGATMTAAGVEQKDTVAPTADWTRGMLQFDGTPLVDAIALANRYSERHIILVGDLGALRVTGAFRAGDTAGLAKALGAAFGLALQQRPDGNLVLTPSPSRRIENKSGG
ncbi:MAG TPA: FecR domain-containing protein, partial [Sphingomicrobium sp.]|nr:FecR domain-containing protein [Sphingomicrobium sp.]